MPTTFAVLSNLNEVLEALPRKPLEAAYALLKRAGDSSPKPLKYNPYRVDRAMNWLKNNNSQYDEILVDSEWYDDDNERDSDDDVELETILATEDDYEGIELNDVATDGSPPVEFLLHVEDDEYDNATQVQKILLQDKSPTLTRSRGVYAADFNTKGFLQKAFVLCYPYGRGKLLLSSFYLVLLSSFYCICYPPLILSCYPPSPFILYIHFVSLQGPLRMV